MKSMLQYPRRSLALAVAVFSLISAPLQAATFYVATDGNDANPGTSTAPWATVNKAAAAAQAGDTVIIRAGTYQPATRITVANSGTASAPITFRAEVAGQAIIDGRSQVPNMNQDGRVGLFEMINKSWIVVDGLRVINSGFWGIWASVCQNVTIQNCSTYNTYGSGILGTGLGSFNIRILNNVVQRACMYPDTSVNTSECITVASVDTFEIAGNIVSDRMVDPSNGGEGIDAKNNCKNGRIYFNTVCDLFRVGIYIDAYGASLSNVQVYGNVIYNTGGGIRVAAESRGTINTVHIRDNVVRDTRREGIGIRGYLRNGQMNNVYVYQNTIVRCGNPDPASSWEDCGILVDADNRKNSNFVVRNNIIRHATSDGPYMRSQGQSYLVVDRNLLFGPAQAGGVIGTNAILADPLFANFAGNDFHLLAGSPAIDAALGSPQSPVDFDGIARPRGAAGDLGAFEF
jgi:polygalacturonase